ncbi:TPA: glycosyltransferase [Burkholderia cenocepacia]|uniref:glycosyltransferase n=1 Tax=Burkholderia cenocepacia TaxID=95486 RepID=UPI001BA1708D|nr:glycosyltransferase [Burkholderia cenocepacia]MBR8429757.1 glycosyltransferase [Burkholderia cenocepacia]
MKLAEKTLYRIISRWLGRGFDANFYLSSYGDLEGVQGKWQALRHYVRIGKYEGRFPNEATYIKNARERKWDLGDGFDIVAYKFFNKDLVSVFSRDEDFFRHYLRHGRAEGRVIKFDAERESVSFVPSDKKWKSLFSMPEFIARYGDDCEEVPQSREAALELFWNQGVEQLWSLSFEYEFDAKFVRESGAMLACHHGSDAELYRIWLTEGFPAGVAPNERVFLASYLGGLPFPLDFNWRVFIKNNGLPGKTTRSQALIALFEEPVHRITAHIDVLGKDAAWLLHCVGRRALAHGDYRKAIVVLKESVAIAPGVGPLCLLGDAYRKSGAVDEALDSYLASIGRDRAPLSAFLHAATIHASRQAFTEAFAILRAAHRIWRQKVEFGLKLHEVIRHYFEYRSAQAHALLREAAGRNFDTALRKEAETLLTETLDEIRGLFLELESLPVPLGGNPNGYVLILANDDLRQCTHYRIEQKALQFERAGIPVKIFSHSDTAGFIDNLVGARAAIFYRVAAVPDILRAILHADCMNLKTYYEIDDLIFDSNCYPDPFASFEGQIQVAEYTGLQFGVPLFRYAMSMCQGSIASTPALAEKMQAITVTDTNILLRNGLDNRNDASIAMGANPVGRKNSRVRVFYGSGTKAHNADFNTLVAPAILELMMHHPQVDLVIVGHLKIGPELRAMGARIITYPIIPDASAYWSILASCDINLAVLEPGVVADCKSEIKWLEAAILKIPSVVSGTRTYREIIKNGIDGFLADSVSQWQAVLRELITRPHLREQVGTNARERVIREYALEVGARTLQAAFETHGGGARLRGNRTRVLVCNVFYAPQSYGGATRVVEDNIRIFAEQYPDLEIGIFCSDEGVTPAGQLRMGSEDGIPVYRLSTPQEVDMDWRPFNETHVKPFERVLDHFQPDIIHFHCIQRLTATIVEVALARRVPYVVTLHDAWWISDSQFLIDDDGLLQLPSTDVLADCVRSRHGVASIVRRHRLMSLLRHSSANLSVSASFARVYASAGVPGIKVVENGVPEIERCVRSGRSDGRVALGLVGGRSPHKGASLIEASLRDVAYQNLHLTMIDGTLEVGQSIDTIWGTTPVALSAPYPQAKVSELYCQLDVLLAPSTWPESFGLVTREALQGGLWVIASRLGAIGEEVDDGRNGYVIDVSNTKDLKRILKIIDDDPERYKGSPSSRKQPFRRVNEQVAELYHLYREIVAGE